MKPRLVRSRTDRMITGVCGGLGAYLGTDSTWVRLFFVLLTLITNGAGILIYIVLAIIVPEGETATTSPEGHVGEDMAQRVTEFAGNVSRSLSGRSTDPQAALFAGLALILLGLVFLANNLGLFRWLRGDLIWPLVLIALGLALLLREIRR
jgi:phage shock protein C